MNRPLLWKSLLVLGMALALLIPLGMIEGQIEARSKRQEAVLENIADTAAGPQQLVGPLLVVSWQQQVERESKGEDGKVTRTLAYEPQQRVFVPRNLHLDAQAEVEERHRGLYKAQLFHLAGTLKGDFDLPAGAGLPPRDGIRAARATLAVGISDLRGIQNRPLLSWAGTPREFISGPGVNVLHQGIHVDLGPAADLAQGLVPFELPLELLGSQSLSMAPVADETTVTLHSPWADPSFGGRFLPTRRQLGASGFEASWKISHLARNLDAILEGNGKEGTTEAFTVSFIDPVNVYLQAERAVKYGLLFVGLTFAGFFLFELLKRLRIHPMQYLLVGLALALFFLLLISLSEHLPFLAAYLIASAACIALLGAYLVQVLGGPARAGAFALGLTLLYGVLYGLLSSEDNALLMGAVLLFGALAAVMLATRKLDWYSLNSAA